MSNEMECNSRGHTGSAVYNRDEFTINGNNNVNFFFSFLFIYLFFIVDIISCSYM